MSEQVRRRINRPAASATWESSHRWGPQIGDVTDLRVTRVDGGSITILCRGDAIEIRKELVASLAEMVAAAAEWSDNETSAR